MASADVCEAPFDFLAALFHKEAESPHKPTGSRRIFSDATFLAF
jgi:hypothetical protein